jgi:ATP-grasp ribosomal peptide maturase
MNPQSTASTVLMLTEATDSTADLVVKELDSRGASIMRVDTADFPLSLQVSARFDGTWHGELRAADRAVDLGDIRSVYVRRPTMFKFPEAMTDAEQRFAGREARRGIGGLLLSLACTWVNHPSRTADAEYKPVQLQAAAACGLSVPRTVITNAPERAAEHGAYLGPAAVYKALASATVADGNKVAFIPTTGVTASDLADLRVALTAHQFQERVPKVRDVRATVVGGRVFAASILSPDAGMIDWRTNYSALRYEPVDLPAEVEAALLALLDRLGLAFAAADFVVTADGAHHFVDLNPSGQWGWIQEATGLPIAAALATHLTGEDR